MDAREEIEKEYKPSPVPVEKPFVDRERQAHAKLLLGKQMLKLGKRDNANQWFAEVLQDFPETEAAKEADVLYQKTAGKKYVRRESTSLTVNRESEAAELLKKCQELAKAGEELDAVRWLTELLTKFPETKAAAAGEKLYEEIAGRKFER